MNMLLDYEPCDKCKELFNRGIQIIGTVTYENDFLPIGEDTSGNVLYPTGGFIVATKDWVKRILFQNNEEGFNTVKKLGKCLIRQELLVDILENIEGK